MFDSDRVLTAGILHKAPSLQVLGLSSAHLADGSILLADSLKFDPRLSILEVAHRLLNTVGRR